MYDPRDLDGDAKCSSLRNQQIVMREKETRTERRDAHGTSFCAENDVMFGGCISKRGIKGQDSDGYTKQLALRNFRVDGRSSVKVTLMTYPVDAMTGELFRYGSHEDTKHIRFIKAVLFSVINTRVAWKLQRQSFLYEFLHPIASLFFVVWTWKLQRAELYRIVVGATFGINVYTLERRPRVTLTWAGAKGERIIYVRAYVLARQLWFLCYGEEDATHRSESPSPRNDVQAESDTRDFRVETKSNFSTNTHTHANAYTRKYVLYGGHTLYV